MSGHTHIHTHRTTTVTLAVHARRGLITIWFVSVSVDTVVMPQVIEFLLSRNSPVARKGKNANYVVTSFPDYPQSLAFVQK